MKVTRKTRNELIICPFNTQVPTGFLRNVVNRSVERAFGNIYNGYRILPHEIATVSDYPPHTGVFAKDVVLGTYSTLNGIPGVGLYPILYKKFGPQHVLVITDMLLNYAGYKAGGTADEERGKAIVTTYEIPQDEILAKRLPGVILHELGHLYGLDHHDAIFGNGKFCPMVDRAYDDVEFETDDSRLAFLETRNDEFCNGCKETIHQISAIV